jgi:hypothetical protein
VQAGPSNRTTRLLRWCLFVGIALRLALFAVNPPTNAFDDHFRPITLYMETGSIPARDACWECYHPPAFYVSSAWISQAALSMGAAPSQIEKLAHFLPCLYGILTLLVLRAILLLSRLPDTAVCIAFATLCFLPRHIYMSAIHSNDTIAYLGVSASAWLIMRALDRGCRPRDIVALAVTMAITVLTKYPSMIVLPMAVASFGAAWWLRVGGSRPRVAVSLSIACAPAVVVLALFAAPNIRDHGKAFPSNLELFHQDYLDSGLGTRDVDFLGFAPWKAIATPILAPENRDSMWTILWARAWFDMEPRFLQYTDPATDAWWTAYDTWLGGAADAAWPGIDGLSSWTRLLGSMLIALGLVPGLLLLIGLFRCLIGRWSLLRPADPLETARLQMMPVLLFGVMAGMVLTTWKFPYTFALKTVYILNGLPAFIVLVALGAAFLDEVPWAKRILVVSTALLCALTTVHILHVVVVMSGA